MKTSTDSQGRRAGPAPNISATPRRPSPMTAAALAGMALISLTGCDAGAAPSDSVPTLPASAETTASAPMTADPEAITEQRALASYEGMWDVYDRAGRAPAADPGDERLAEYAAGRALDLLVEGLSSLREQGLVVEGHVMLNPEVVVLSPSSGPTEARIEDCGDSSEWVTVDARSGEVTDEARGRQLITATVADAGDGQWKVTDFAVRAVGTCG